MVPKLSEGERGRIPEASTLGERGKREGNIKFYFRLNYFRM